MSTIKEIEMDSYIEILDKALSEIFHKKNTYESKIYEAMEYSLFTGGKRLRPIMALKSFELFDDNINKVLPFAMAIEMIHTYSLIHDDLPSMDNDDFRRGKPTNHKVFGEAMAILAGDGLLNLAFETMVDASINNYDKKYLIAMREISKYSGCSGMIGGQVLDLISSYDNMNEDKLIYMYKTKTAGLIQASIISGAILGGANEYEINALRDFGLYLGLAYQVRDDLLDTIEDDSINKFTYLKFYDKESAEKEVKILSNKAISALDLLKDKDTSFFRELTYCLIERNT